MAIPQKIGFIIDPEAHPKAMVKGIVVQEIEKDIKFWPSGPTHFCRRIFLLAEFACRVLKGKTQARIDSPTRHSDLHILLERQKSPFGFISDYLFDLGTQPDEFAAIPKELRDSVLKVFNRRRDKKNSIIGLPLNWTGEQFFFWTVAEFLYHTKLLDLPTLPTLVTVQAQPGQTLDETKLKEIAEHVFAISGSKTKPPTWQEIYKSALRKTGVNPEDPLLVLKAREVINHQEEIDDGFTLNPGNQKSLQYIGNPQDVMEIFHRYDRILLTGPSGSGKTTTLRLGVHSLIQSTHAANFRLPIFLTLKDLEVILSHPHLKTQEGDVGRIIDRALSLAICRTIDEGCDEALLRKSQPVKDYTALGNRETVLSKPQMVNIIEQAVLNWLITDHPGYSQLAIFLDDLGGGSTRWPSVLQERLKSLFHSQAQLILAVRSSFIEEVPSFAEGFTRFELLPLSEDQIVQHLDSFPEIQGQGKRLLDTRVHSDRRLWKLTQIPFFWDKMVFLLRRPGLKCLPKSRSELLSLFIEELLHCFNCEAEKVTLPVLEFVLKKIAFEQLRRQTVSPQRDLIRYPDDFQTVHVENLEQILQFAQRCGILSHSGLQPGTWRGSGQVAFVHDHFKYYFAAKFLLSLPTQNLLGLVPELFEHLEWDEVWLLFFEMCRDGNVLELLIGRLGPFSPSFTALCVGQSLVLDASFRLERAQQAAQFLREAGPVYKGTMAFDERTNSALAALEPLSVSELVPLALDRTAPAALRDLCWQAIMFNARAEDFEALKSLYQKGFAVEDNPEILLLCAIGKIPLRDAFVFAWEEYRKSQRPEKDLIPLILTCSLGYRATLADIIKYIPEVYYPNLDFASINIVAEDFPLIDECLMSGNPHRVALIHQIMIHDQSLEVLAFLLQLWGYVKSKDDVDFSNKTTWVNLLTHLHKIDVSSFQRILTQMAVRHFSSPANFDIDDADLAYFHFWSAVAPPATLRRLIQKITCSPSRNFDDEFQRLKYLENWPCRSEVFTILKELHQTTPFPDVKDAAEFLCLWLGDRQFESVFEAKFRYLFERYKKNVGGTLFQSLVCEWWLPFHYALRAAGNVPSMAPYLLELIRDPTVSDSLLYEGIYALSKLRHHPLVRRAIQKELTIQEVTRLFELIYLSHQPFESLGIVQVRDAFEGLMEALSADAACSFLFFLGRTYASKCLREEGLLLTLNLTDLQHLISEVFRYADANTQKNILQFIRQALDELPPQNKRFVWELYEELTFAARRRFLSDFPINN